MSDTRKVKQESVKREPCLKESRCSGGSGHVIHFYGLGRYQQWHDKARQRPGGPLIYNPRHFSCYSE